MIIRGKQSITLASLKLKIITQALIINSQKSICPVELSPPRVRVVFKIISGQMHAYSTESVLISLFV